jgi:hypothetical protein
MVVKRFGKKAEDRCVWALILQELLVKLQGPFANEELEVEGRYRP